MKRYEKLYPANLGANITLKLMAGRLGNLDIPPKYYPDTIDNANLMASELTQRGGLPQQERMVKDKRKSLDKATLYSYQAVRVKKIQDKNLSRHGFEGSSAARALINPDKRKFDYDDKILSIGFEHGFEVGDVFEWERTNSYWLITLQDLDEIAYFRAEIRRADYEINWLDEDGNEWRSFAAVRGPVETKINFIQKHQISVDEPNYSLHVYLPKNEHTMKQFKRYSKFYLKDAESPDDNTCWRVEATDSISTKGILEFTAVEYYANETEDDVEKGLVKAFVEKHIEPEANPKEDIVGPTFIKPKLEYEYYVEAKNTNGDWFIDGPKVPVTLEKFITPRGIPGVKVKWNSNQSGSFILWFGEDEHYKNFSKTIVVESLF